MRETVTLLSGSLISGSVEFVPAEAGLTIVGEASLTVDEVAPLFAAGRLGVLDLTILHPPEDYGFTSPTTVRVAADSGTDGAFAAAPPAAPEELGDWSTIGAQVTQNFEETGYWFH